MNWESANCECMNLATPNSWIHQIFLSIHSIVIRKYHELREISWKSSQIRDCQEINMKPKISEDREDANWEDLLYYNKNLKINTTLGNQIIHSDFALCSKWRKRIFIFISKCIFILFSKNFSQFYSLFVLIYI